MVDLLSAYVDFNISFRFEQRVSVILFFIIIGTGFLSEVEKVQIPLLRFFSALCWHIYLYGSAQEFGFGFHFVSFFRCLGVWREEEDHDDVR
jgi:hypothetical protein